MKRYIDTSVLASVYCSEPASLRCEKALQSSAPVISRLTRLEFSSAVAKKLRTKELDKIAATRIIAMFREHIRQGIFVITAITEAHYALADEWVSAFTTPLRTMDALHLAIARHNGIPLVTSDKTLVRSAKILGVEVWVP